MSTVRVNAEHPYSVEIDYGSLSRLPGLVGQATRVAVIYGEPLAEAALTVSQLVGSENVAVLSIEVPAGEAAKTPEVLVECWRALAEAGFTRADLIIGVGGGATTDLAGFVADSWLRGVPYLSIPTTVLAMVDAAVGGKTGIDLPEGKNLVGAFWAPAAVVVDLEVLDTLPRNEILTGFAEIVKAGFIARPEILEILEADVDAATDPSTPEFRRCIELAIEMKAEVVGKDFREAGLREILNYGHTLAHAIEHAERYRWRHGAAVSIGMVFAAELSRLAGRLSDETVQRHRDILESLSLPTSYPGGRWPTLLATMQRDKKTRSGMLRFIVLDDIARPTIMSAPDDSLLFAAYQEIAD